MKLSEDKLCELFADGVRDDVALRRFLLSKTKFAQFADKCRLLHEEQMLIRPRRRWWRHWWCTIPELAKQRETDIFMVFEVVPTRMRFALHIENKRDNYKFNPGQAKAYEPRGRHMLNKPEYLSYSDFQTVLLAPPSFRDRYRDEAGLFNLFIGYDEVAHFIPAFGLQNSD